MENIKTNEKRDSIKLNKKKLKQNKLPYFSNERNNYKFSIYLIIYFMN